MSTEMLKWSIQISSRISLCATAQNLFSRLDVTLWRAFLPSELCFSESSNRWGANPLLGLHIWLYRVVFGISHALSPLLKEGCHRLMYPVILPCNKACSGFGQKQTLWIRSAEFHETACCVWKQQSWRSSLTDAAKQCCYSEQLHICVL